MSSYNSHETCSSFIYQLYGNVEAEKGQNFKTCKESALGRNNSLKFYNLLCFENEKYSNLTNSYLIIKVLLTAKVD